MGLMVDTNVFILFERTGRPVNLSPWAPSEEIFISAVTVSELLMGVHRADNEPRRKRRLAFVEAILAGITALDFTTEVARLHADIAADLMRRGQLIGAHDLIIAATARHHTLSLLTDNVAEFIRVPGLHVIEFAR
ncbi:MAG: type II toxin-antitoxin system VapC family toxin [Planctomycetes bacterium]|nr:type II toxin-antitoxin system VapC family toxin [Planctomycetota bacterium]